MLPSCGTGNRNRLWPADVGWKAVLAALLRHRRHHRPAAVADPAVEPGHQSPTRRASRRGRPAYWHGCGVIVKSCGLRRGVFTGSPVRRSRVPDRRLLVAPTSHEPNRIGGPRSRTARLCCVTQKAATHTHPRRLPRTLSGCRSCGRDRSQPMKFGVHADGSVPSGTTRSRSPWAPPMASRADPFRLLTPTQIFSPRYSLHAAPEGSAPKTWRRAGHQPWPRRSRPPKSRHGPGGPAGRSSRSLSRRGSRWRRKDARQPVEVEGHRYGPVRRDDSCRDLREFFLPGREPGLAECEQGEVFAGCRHPSKDRGTVSRRPPALLYVQGGCLRPWD